MHVLFQIESFVYILFPILSHTRMVLFFLLRFCCDVLWFLIHTNISCVSRRKFMTWEPNCFASVVFILMLLDCAQWLNEWFYLSVWTCHLFRRPIWWQKSLQIWGSGNFEPLNLLQKPFKRAECCIWSRRDEGKKVTGFRLFERRNMSEVIYTPVLTRPWVVDFHSELEKAAACSEVTDS